MTDLSAFGVEPQDPSEPDETDDETDEPLWPACADCEYRGPEVSARLGQSVELCTACFVDREGLV